MVSSQRQREPKIQRDKDSETERKTQRYRVKTDGPPEFEEFSLYIIFYFL